MLFHLINHILLHTKPRDYIDIKQCSKILDFKSKLYKNQFITEHYYERFDTPDYVCRYKKTQIFYTKLNNYSYNKEFIVISNTWCDSGIITKLYTIKHKIKTDKISIDTLDFEFDQINGNNYSYLSRDINLINHKNYFYNMLWEDYNSRKHGLYFHRHKKQEFVWYKRIDKYTYNKTLGTIKNVYKIKLDILNESLEEQKLKNYPIFIDIKNKNFELNKNFTFN